VVDDVDRKIISQLQKDGRTSFKELGELVGYTGMGAKKRVERLIERDAIKISALLNLERFELSAAIVLLEMKDSKTIKKLLQRFRECPRVVNIFTAIGGYNLIALVVAEDNDTLESISMEECSLRSSEGIRRSEFYPVGKIYYTPFLAVRAYLTRKDRAVSPCGVDCRLCQRFCEEKCVGCPTASYYRGTL